MANDLQDALEEGEGREVVLKAVNALNRGREEVYARVSVDSTAIRIYDGAELPTWLKVTHDEMPGELQRPEDSGLRELAGNALSGTPPDGPKAVASFDPLTPAMMTTSHACPENRTAVIYAPSVGRMDLQKVGQDLTETGYAVDIFPNEQANLRKLMQVLDGDYGIILFKCHGGQVDDGHGNLVTALMTGQPYDSSDAYYRNSLTESQRNHLVRFIPSHIVQPFFAFTPGFLEGFTFRSTFVYAGACESLGSIIFWFSRNTDMADAFLERGAALYAGFRGTIEGPTVARGTEVFFEEFARLSATAAGARLATLEDADLRFWRWLPHFITNSLDITRLELYPGEVAETFQINPGPDPRSTLDHERHGAWLSYANYPNIEGVGTYHIHTIPYPDGTLGGIVRDDETEDEYVITNGTYDGVHLAFEFSPLLGETVTFTGRTIYSIDASVEPWIVFPTFDGMAGYWSKAVGDARVDFGTWTLSGVAAGPASQDRREE